MPCPVQFVVRIQFNLGYRVDMHNCSTQSDLQASNVTALSVEYFLAEYKI